MSDKEIPPSLIASEEPKEGDLCVRRDRDGSYVLSVWCDGEWDSTPKHHRIVGAVCVVAWEREYVRLESLWHDLDACGKLEDAIRVDNEANAAERQAELWRKYADGQ